MMENRNELWQTYPEDPGSVVEVSRILDDARETLRRCTAKVEELAAENDALRAALAPVARELKITTNTKGGVYLDRDEAAAVLAACQDCPGAPAKSNPRPLNETSG